MASASLCRRASSSLAPGASIAAGTDTRAGNCPTGSTPSEPAHTSGSGGFSPWWNERLHGSNAPRCFGHNGMNGCAAYADPDAGLALVVLKNVYDPQLAYDGPGDDVAELFAAVRAEVVEGGE